MQKIDNKKSMRNSALITRHITSFKQTELVEKLFLIPLFIEFLIEDAITNENSVSVGKGEWEREWTAADKVDSLFVRRSLLRSHTHDLKYFKISLT